MTLNKFITDTILQTQIGIMEARKIIKEVNINPSTLSFDVYINESGDVGMGGKNKITVNIAMSSIDMPKVEPIVIPEPIVEKVPVEVINEHQYQELLIQLDGYSSIAKDIMDVYGIDTLADMPASDYRKARTKIDKIKRAHEEYDRNKS